MDNRSFLSRLAKATDQDNKTAAALAAALTNIIGTAASENANVALPGFGTFESVKSLESVDTDPATGSRTLVPPSIKVIFKPGSRLKKAVAKL